MIKIWPEVRFTVELAGIPIEVRARHRQTEAFCRDYLTAKKPAFSVRVERGDIRREREYALRQAKAEGHPRRWFSGKSLETLALCRKIMAELIGQDVLLFHGAVMALDGKAYLFTAKSGTGKTTHCRLWLKAIPNCHILNGDKPLLLFRNGGVYACASPWRGKEKYGVNEILPLEAICVLERDWTNHIEAISLKDCFETLMNQSYIPDGNFVNAAKLIKHFSAVKLYRLGCNMEDDAARVAYQTMVHQNQS